MKIRFVAFVMWCWTFGGAKLCVKVSDRGKIYVQSNNRIYRYLHGVFRQSSIVSAKLCQTDTVNYKTITYTDLDGKNFISYVCPAKSLEASSEDVASQYIRGDIQEMRFHDIAACVSYSLRYTDLPGNSAFIWSSDRTCKVYDRLLPTRRSENKKYCVITPFEIRQPRITNLDVHHSVAAADLFDCFKQIYELPLHNFAVWDAHICYALIRDGNDMKLLTEKIPDGNSMIFIPKKAITNSCINNPCSPGNCILNWDGFHCDCPLGYRINQDGTACEVLEVVLCDSSQCSGGTCHRYDGMVHHMCSNCPMGYNLSNSMRDCIDIDECQEAPLCSQICTNMPGTYKCSCLEDYELDQDGISCISRSKTILDQQRCDKDCSKNEKCEYIADSYRCVCIDTYGRDDNQCSGIKDEVPSDVKIKSDGLSAVTERQRYFTGINLKLASAIAAGVLIGLILVGAMIYVMRIRKISRQSATFSRPKGFRRAAPIQFVIQ